MPKAFLDANIFFAAVASRTGGSYFILELAKQRMIEIATVAYALSEAERNIQKKLGSRALAAHYENLLAASPVVQSLAQVPKEQEERLAALVSAKDIPIVLGAFLNGATALITLDRKHLLDNTRLHTLMSNIAVMTPGDFIQKYFL